MNTVSATPAQASHRASPFRKRTVVALVIASFLAFLALLALIGAGQTREQSNDGGSHAASNGLNGYSGLVELLRNQDRNVTVSRSPSGFETFGLLVLTPPINADPEDIQSILEDRFYTGPTLIILPKWYARRVQDDITDDVRVEDGWVQLLFASAPEWIEELEEPYWFSIEQPWRKEVEDAAEEAAAEDEEPVSVFPTMADAEEFEPTNWAGYGLSGTLPDGRHSIANEAPGHSPMVTAADGGALVTNVWGEEGSDFYDNAYPVAFVIEPDLMNNYGLADETRAAVALAVMEEMTYEWDSDITFDVSLNGLGGTQNLLTLAFTPPFLAATLCLIMALIIIGWRAFVRFGPPLAESQAIAFGKRRLVSNGAGLILRARRLGLLAGPYVALTTRRIGQRLGLRKADLQTVSETLARRFPDEEPLINRANAMRQARKPKDILRTARALKELERKLDT